MIKVRVKFFAVLTDVVGAKELAVEINKEKATVKEILEYIRNRYPKFKEIEKDIPILTLVNGVNVLLDEEVKNGDEVSLLPPVSGGC